MIRSAPYTMGVCRAGSAGGWTVCAYYSDGAAARFETPFDELDQAREAMRTAERLWAGFLNSKQERA